VVQACLKEGKIVMSARRQVTDKLREAYEGASKPDKGQILDEVVSTTGVARSSARRLLVGPKLPDPQEQVDKRVLLARTYSGASRDLLTHVWLLMGMPCGKYFVVMLPQWLPLMLEARDLDRPFTTTESMREVSSMSAATVDRY
jgi:hypothetical protein